MPPIKQQGKLFSYWPMNVLNKWQVSITDLISAWLSITLIQNPVTNMNDQHTKRGRIEIWFPTQSNPGFAISREDVLLCTTCQSRLMRIPSTPRHLNRSVDDSSWSSIGDIPLEMSHSNLPDPHKRSGIPTHSVIGWDFHRHLKSMMNTSGESSVRILLVNDPTTLT